MDVNQVNGSDIELLTVRETARRLGVHENTIRNWATKGTLPSARLPGAKFNTFDARDVERLRKRRGTNAASIAASRRTIGPELVDTPQLNHWATTRQSQDKFPALVRRLLVATPGINNISMRAGDSVSISGWDGKATSDGQPAYFPAGTLALELGVGAKPKQKAQDDYDSRTKNPRDVVPSESVFIFITPRRWKDSDKWVTERKADGIWADVRVLDADDLEGWLDATPAVHYWISELLGRSPRNAVSLERWWDLFQLRTMPPLPRELFLAGRGEERDELLKFLSRPAGVKGIKAPARDDAIAFIHASLTEVGDFVEQLPLVVSSADVWSRVVDQPGRAILIPVFEEPDLQSAVANGHFVLAPYSNDQIASGESIKLAAPALEPAREALKTALADAGKDPDDAHRLAAMARRSIPALMRKLAQNAHFARPDWARDVDGSLLAPLVLVGRWTEGEADRDVAAEIAGRAWSEIEPRLIHWRLTEDPPFVRTSGTWHLASPEEAFTVLQPLLTRDTLEKWHAIATRTLTELDPMIELTGEERMTAPLRGVAADHSSTIRAGLASSLALVASVGDEPMNDDVTAADHAARVVHDILAAANADESMRIWRSLSPELPLLAEAAPDTFLRMTEELGESHPTRLAAMFQDGDDSSWLYSSSPHTGLLWALETLCWAPVYLPRAALALARLDEIDPGGRLGNRPLSSLSSVLVPWIRHTSASVRIRVGTLSQICEKCPDVGWKLLLALWPSYHASSSPPHEPRFQNWAPENPGVPMPEWFEYVGAIVDLALELAGNDALRISDLGERLDALPPDMRIKVMDRIEAAVDSAEWSRGARLEVWERLRKETAKHREFDDAEWSMDAETLDRLESIADKIEPSDESERLAYLFDWRPDLPEVSRRSHAEYDARLNELRSKAIAETLEVDGLDGINRLAGRAPLPRAVGWTVGTVAGDEHRDELIKWLADGEGPRFEVACAWAGQRIDDEGGKWLKDSLSQVDASAAEHRLALTLCAPMPGREIWEALSDDEALTHAYWERVRVFRVDAADVEEAAHQLLAHDRAWPAVDLLSSALHPTGEVAPALPVDLVTDVLDQAIQSEPTGDRVQSLAYELGKLLDYLDEHEIGTERMATYEWAFYRALDHYRDPKALFESLASEPQRFVDLVSMVYRGNQENQRQSTEQGQGLATHAWRVLNGWHKLPGMDVDGKLDGEHLKQWVNEARRLLDDAGRAEIGDEQVGQVLSASPVGTDGAWPAEPVRDVIESVGNRRLEAGIHTGLVNSRGTTTRGVYDGGTQERELAAKYREYASRCAENWQRTASLLRGIADDYERDARRMDQRAQLDADLEF